MSTKNLAIMIALVAILGGGGIYYFAVRKSPETNNDSNTMAENNGNKQKTWSIPPEMKIDENKIYRAIMKTSAGDIKIEFFAKETPVAVNNFIFLSKNGFYDGTKFHRIIKEFMVQGGDPLGNGTGGPGYKFDDEPVMRNYERGIIAMANAGPNTNGSQFFIITKNTPLPKNYVIFGKMTDGFDTLDKIAATPVIANSSGEVSKPTQDIIVKSVTISE